MLQVCCERKWLLVTPEESSFVLVQLLFQVANEMGNYVEFQDTESNLVFHCEVMLNTATAIEYHFICITPIVFHIRAAYTTQMRYSDKCASLDSLILGSICAFGGLSAAKSHRNNKPHYYAVLPSLACYNEIESYHMYTTHFTSNSAIEFCVVCVLKLSHLW